MGKSAGVRRRIAAAQAGKAAKRAKALAHDEEVRARADPTLFKQLAAQGLVHEEGPIPVIHLDVEIVVAYDSESMRFDQAYVKLAKSLGSRVFRLPRHVGAQFALKACGYGKFLVVENELMRNMDQDSKMVGIDRCFVDEIIPDLVEPLDNIGFTNVDFSVHLDDPIVITDLEDESPSRWYLPEVIRQHDLFVEDEKRREAREEEKEIAFWLNPERYH